MSEYIKLSGLVDSQFTINKVFGYRWKMWDTTSKKMLMSEKWEQGYRKMYTLETDKGTLDLSASQLGNLLEAVTKDGRADINGRSFSVKSNGKTGMDIRYYLNAVKETERPVAQESDPYADQNDIPLDSIPF